MRREKSGEEWCEHPGGGTEAAACLARRIQFKRDLSRNGLDFGAEVPLDAVKVMSILIRNQIDGKAKVPVSTASANAMEVGFTVVRQIKVDNHVH